MRLAAGEKLSRYEIRSQLGALRAPGLVNLDFLIARNFQLTETKRLELRGEFFNLTNTAHFGRPNATIGSPQAGRIITTAAPNRQVQVGLRLAF